MNYREATDYIEKLQTEVGSDLSLKQIKYLADKVGNPENKSRIIHIAGTNGKGSVGNFIAGILAMSDTPSEDMFPLHYLTIEKKYKRLPEIYMVYRKNIYQNRKLRIISHILLKRRTR